MRRLRGVVVLLPLIAVGGLLVGCGEDGVAPEPTCESLTEEGWTLFETGRFALAARAFGEAIGIDADCRDAYNGRGWARLNLDTFVGAISDFDEALTRGVTTADPYAGQAVAFRDLEPGDFEEAVSAADSALGRDLRYSFSHDWTFNWMDLRLILAQSYYHLGEYKRANTQIDSLRGTLQDPASDTFVEDLLAEIERLGDLLAGQ